MTLKEAVEIQRMSWNNLTPEEKEVILPMLKLAEQYLSESKEITISEGKICKGGKGQAPTTKRPTPPKPQK